MTKKRPGVIEYSLLGLLLGAMVVIKLFLFVGPWILVTLPVTAVLGGISVRWIQPLSEQVKDKLLYYITGVIVGLLIGFPLLNTPWLGIPIGLAIGIAFYRFVIFPWTARLKEKDKYLSYPGEGFIIPLFSFVGSLEGGSICNHITKAFPHIPAWLTPEMSIALVLLVSLISFPIGVMIASNRYRPAVGGVFLLIGGALVTWVGINVAPFLFMPKSGLYWMGMAVGLAICAVACLSFAFTDKHLPLGITAIILSILSFLGAAGGLIIGGLLGILGGAMVLAWEKVVLPEPEEILEALDTELILPPGNAGMGVSQ